MVGFEWWGRRGAAGRRLLGALAAALCAASVRAETWHYAQMDFELYRLEAMRGGRA